MGRNIVFVFPRSYSLLTGHRFKWRQVDESLVCYYMSSKFQSVIAAVILYLLFAVVAGSPEAMAGSACDQEWRTFSRSEVKYSNESERFVLPSRNFQRQYAHIYAARLWALRPKLEAAANRRWGSQVAVCRCII